MKLLIIDNAEPADHSFNVPLHTFVTAVVECDVINYTKMPPPDEIRATYDAVVLSGVPLHYSFESIDERSALYMWLRQADMPVLGICLGHQVIGEVFGGKIKPQKIIEHGVVATHTDRDDPLFSQTGRTFDTFMMHRAFVTVPADFVRLAHTDLCNNAMMRHKAKPIYGIQAHPELSPSGPALLQSFITMKMPRA
jgi:GMP synthase (glutamine-hydrolysing)